MKYKGFEVPTITNGIYSANEVREAFKAGIDTALVL